MGLILGCIGRAPCSRSARPRKALAGRVQSSPLYTPLSAYSNIEYMGDENVLAWVRARLTCSGRVGENVARNRSRPGHPSQSMRGGREEEKHR